MLEFRVFNVEFQSFCNTYKVVIQIFYSFVVIFSSRKSLLEFVPLPEEYDLMLSENIFVSWNLFLSNLSKYCLLVFFEKKDSYKDLLFLVTIPRVHRLCIIVFLKLLVINFLLFAFSAFFLMGTYLFKFSKNIFWN